MLGRAFGLLGWHASKPVHTPVRIDLDLAWVSCLDVALSDRLQPEDVWFQLQMEAQALMGLPDTPLAMDYEVLPDKAEPHPLRSDASGRIVYRVYAVPQAWVQHVQTIADKHSLRLERVGVCQDNAPILASTGALDFLPHRQRRWRQQRNLWWWRMAMALLAGLLTVCLFNLARAAWMAQGYAPEAQRLATLQAVATHRTQLDQLTQTLQQTTRAHDDWVLQTAWQEGQVQWQRVLQSASPRLWLQHVLLEKGHWRIKGQALSESEVQGLVSQLKALSIWQQVPSMERLHLLTSSEGARLPVWQFELAGVLKGWPKEVSSSPSSP